MAQPSEQDKARTPPGGGSVNPNVDWGKAARQPAFRELVSAKVRFLVPLIVFYMAFYLGITLLAGFAPGFMARRVIGPINVGYLLIFATYLMAWILALVYVRVANRSFDPRADSVIAALGKRKENV